MTETTVETTEKVEPQTEIVGEYDYIKDLKLKYSLFLGCVIPNRYPMIERASRNVFKKIGVELVDMEGASCCPAPGVFRSVDKALWYSMSARNITIAERAKNDLLTLCNGCYGTLLEVDEEMKHDEELNVRINEILKSAGLHFEGSTNVRQVMDVLYNDIGLDKIRKLVKKKLGLRVAVHYGCHLLKPSGIRPFKGEFENPTFFDEVVDTLGNHSLDYPSKFQCCGAGGAVRTSFKDTSLQFTLEKMRSIKKSGADVIVVCCPFCFLQFDLGQVEMKSMLNEGEEPFDVPVLFITQLMGLAMGMDPVELGLVKPAGMTGISPFVDHVKLLEKIAKEAAKNE